MKLSAVLSAVALVASSALVPVQAAAQTANTLCPEGTEYVIEVVCNRDTLKCVVVFEGCV